MTSVQYRDFENGDEAGIVSLLRNCMPRGWGDVEHWRWKYSLRPGFDRARISVAVWDGSIVGCLHTTSVNVVDPAGRPFWASLDGDFAVAPAHRFGHIANALHQRTQLQILRCEDVVRGGFTTTTLHERFYSRVWGYRLASPRVIELAKAL